MESKQSLIKPQIEISQIHLGFFRYRVLRLKRESVYLQKARLLIK